MIDVHVEITDQMRRHYAHVAYQHMLYVMDNKDMFKQDDHFSTVQYMNESGYKNGLKFNSCVIEKIKQSVRNWDQQTYLNFGVAAGSLEMANNHWNKPLNMKSVEWDAQLPYCKVVREKLGVGIDYVCNDILNDDFQIYGCNERFSHVILQRFFPLYKTIENFDKTMKEMSRYADIALIVEAESNFKFHGLWDQVIERCYFRGHIHPNAWSLFKLDLRNYRD